MRSRCWDVLRPRARSHARSHARCVASGCSDRVEIKSRDARATTAAAVERAVGGSSFRPWLAAASLVQGRQSFAPRHGPTVTRRSCAPPRRTDSVTRRTCASCVRARALPSAPPAVGTPPGRYDEQCSTDDLYEDVAQPLVGFVARGGRATIFAYGQTGSGKARVSLYLVVGASRRACPRAKARCSLVGRSDVTEKRADGRAPYPKTSEPPSLDGAAPREVTHRAAPSDAPSDAPSSAKGSDAPSFVARRSARLGARAARRTRWRACSGARRASSSSCCRRRRPA